MSTREGWLVAILMSAFVGGCDSSKDDRPSIQQLPIPLDYVALYTLNKTIDGTYTVGVKDRDGRIWYSTEVPGFDLSFCDVEATIASIEHSGQHVVLLHVKKSHWNRLADWSNSHRGEFIGLLIAGKLIEVVQLRGPLTSIVSIPCHSEEEAFELAKTIRQS